MWLVEPLEREVAYSLFKALSLPGLLRLAIMPDVHLSSGLCVGSVLGTRDILYPAAIGGDIGCGMATLRLHADNAPDANALLHALLGQVNVLMRRDAATTPTANMPDPAHLSHLSLRKFAQRQAYRQLGTLGRGNHFIEFQRDDDGHLWIMVHSGSRAIGQSVAAHHTTIASMTGVRSSLDGLSIESHEGLAYLKDQQWCVQYAKANRLELLRSAASAAARSCGIQPDWSTLIDVPHNLLSQETHNGERLIVHRKGAATAIAGAAGIIPGSAGTFSVHVEGRGDPDAMASSSHGAGRLLSRSDAKRVITAADVRCQMRDVAFEESKASQLRDEVPGVYRDLAKVLKAQRSLVKVVRRVRTFASFKASG
jgi:tRNA-splicing ligase RtcB